MGKAITRAALVLSLLFAMFGVLGGAASHAATRCEALSSAGFLCVTTPPNGGVEIFLATDPSFQNVIGVGIECFGGHYYVQYQTGGPDTYRPVPLFDLGTACRVVS